MGIVDFCPKALCANTGTDVDVNILLQTILTLLGGDTADGENSVFGANHNTIGINHQ